MARQRQNVLQLIHSFIQGGSERQMIQLTKLLIDSGNYRVHVACLDGGGVLRPEIDVLAIDEVPEFPLTSFYDLNMVTQLRRFREFVKEREISLIQTHDFYSNIFGMAGAALARIPVRIASRRETTGMRSAAQKSGERLAFSLAHAIVTNAQAVKEALAGEGVAASKIEVVHNGLDLDRLTPRNLSRTQMLGELGLPPDLGEERKIVTLVANLRHDVKDHPMFLRAAQQVQREVPEAAFVLAGEGSLTESMRALANELGVGESTFFIGRCEHVPDLLRLSSVCILSSKAEGFSNAILEYMAAGRAVVATDVGGAREAIAEGVTGYLVASGDDEAMANRIVFLLQNPAVTDAMGAKARQVVESEFSCESQVRKTEALYERLLARNVGQLKEVPLKADDNRINMGNRTSQ